MKDEPVDILIVEDEEDHAELIRLAFESSEWPARLHWSRDLAGAREALAGQKVDLVITDMKLPDGAGLDLVRENGKARAPVVVMTGHGDENVAVEVMKAGAMDYLVKSPESLARVPRIAEMTLNAWRNIRERGKAEEALRESEQRLDLALEGGNLGIWDWDVESGEEVVNERWAEMIGYKLGEIECTAASCEAMIHPADKDEVMASLEAHLAGETDRYEAEFRIRTKSGDYKWILERGKVVERDAEGKALRVSGTRVDVHERRTAEEALEFSTKRLACLNKIANIFLTKKDDEVYPETLEAVLDALDSSLGYLGYIDDNGDLVCPTMTWNVWDKCDVPEKSVVFPRSAWGGLWGRSLIERISLRQNGGLSAPEGHLPLDKAMAVPIMHGNEVVGQIVVANKDADYTLEDQDLLENICSTIAPVLRARLRADRQEEERIKAELATAEAEKRLRVIAENVPQFICRLDLDARLTYVNRIFPGTRMEDIVGASYYDFSPEEDWPAMKAAVKEVLDTGRMQVYETRAIGPEDKPHWYENRLSAIRGEDGTIEGIVVSAVDITERRRTEELIRLQRDLAKTAGSCNGIEEAAEDILEIALGIHGVNCGSFLAEDPASGDLKMAARRGASGRLADALAWIEKGSAAYEWVAAESNRFLLADDPFPPADRERREDGVGAMAIRTIFNQGRPMAALVLGGCGDDEMDSRALEAIDVVAAETGAVIARISAEEALRRAEERVRSFIESVEDMVYFQARDGSVTMLNDSAERVSGYALEDFIEDRNLFFRIVHPDDRPGIEASLDRSDSGESSLEVEYRLFSKDKKWLVINSRRTPVLGESGEVAGYNCVDRDITGIRRAEEERRKMESQVLHAQKLESLGVLAGGIAHDFNNLLAGIIGNAGLALAELDREHPVREFVQGIVRGAESAAELSKQMLAYSGRGRFVTEQVNISSVVEAMTQLLEASISKKAAIYYNLGHELPKVEADATQIRQLVLTLVTNASEALEGKAGLVTVNTGTMECESSYLESCYFGEGLEAGRYSFVEVSDTGRGIDKNDEPRIFDPFFSSKFTGRGLGLAAASGIIRGHKGAIRVTSQPGRGSTFRALFRTAEQPGRRDEKRPAPAEEAGKRSAVLLVDDEKFLLQVVRKMVLSLGYDVITAEDGLEAVEQFRKHKDRVSLVLLDLTMPRMSGEEAFAEIRQIDPAAKVIVSSGYNETEVWSRFEGANLDGFLQKPYQMKELKEIFDKVMG